MLPLPPGWSSHDSGVQQYLSTQQDGPCHLGLPHRVSHPLFSQVSALVAESYLHSAPSDRSCTEHWRANSRKSLFHRSSLRSWRMNSNISSCVRHRGCDLRKRQTHTSIEEIRFEKERRRKGKRKQPKTDITSVIYSTVAERHCGKHDSLQ